MSTEGLRLEEGGTEIVIDTYAWLACVSVDICVEAQYISPNDRPVLHLFLPQLGILDVFEPRVADLSPMTSDLGVYARDVQQSIGVNIRNYMKPDRTHSRESSNVVPPRRDHYRYLPPGPFYSLTLLHALYPHSPYNCPVTVTVSTACNRIPRTLMRTSWI